MPKQNEQLADDMPCWCDCCEKRFRMDLIVEDSLFSRIVEYLTTPRPELSGAILCSNKVELLCPKCICETIIEMDGFCAYRLIEII